jgi:L-aminopeptidase/D-esterase-like protein
VDGLEGFRIGHATLDGAVSGCSVVLPPPGSLGGVAVRGGAPGTREAAALGPTGGVEECHAVLLSGGSAFGLAAADGAVAWCEEHGSGFDMGVARVPVVGAAIVFDLRAAGQPRPGPAEGRAACRAAQDLAAGPPATGRVGVGAGCTVGKAAGPAHAAPGGVGWAVARGGGVTVGALMAVNALGDVVDEDGTVLAGSTAPPAAPRYPLVPLPGTSAGQQTVIGCLVTDARLGKAEACRAADLAHTGIARAVEPPHTTLDGDALFLLCAQRVAASVDLVAHLGARAVAAAIRQAVRKA